MDFATIGTLSSYVKQKNLTFAAKHKIRTGQTLTNSNGNFVPVTTLTFDKLSEAAKTSNDQAKAQKLALIKRKLKAGQKLTDEELGFLRVNDPKTYKKAKEADEAREELKAELKKAKSKDEARDAMTRAMLKASSTAMSELSALSQNGGGTPAGGAMCSGGDTMNISDGAVSSGGDAMNISSGEVTATEGNVNISGAANQTLADVNQSIQTAGENATDAINGDDKNSPLQKTFDDPDNMTPEDIMEKYIWTIRALENEWFHFTGSKDYKDLPDHSKDKDKVKKIHKQIVEPNRRLFEAATAYRKAMMT